MVLAYEKPRVVLKTTVTWKEGSIIVSMMRRMNVVSVERNAEGCLVIHGTDAVLMAKGGYKHVPRQVTIKPSDQVELANRCSAETRSGGYSSSVCNSAAKYGEKARTVHYNGEMDEPGQDFEQGFCGTHAPSKVSERLAKKHAEATEAYASRQAWEKKAREDKHARIRTVVAALKGNDEASEAFKALMRDVASWAWDYDQATKEEVAQ